MRPDVAIIAPYPPRGTRHGGHSGVASYSANLAGALADAGAKVAVIADRIEGDPDVFTDGDVTDGEVEVHRSFTLGPAALPVAARAALALGAPVVHLQWELFLYGGPPSLPGLLPALSALRWARGAPPLITTMHQVVQPEEIDAGYTRLHRVSAPAVVARRGLATVQSSIARASSAVVVHEDSFRAAIDRGEGRTAVIPHGIEARVPEHQRRSREALGVAHDRMVALCFGFLAPYKGLEAALAAAELAGPGIELVVAGGEHPRLAGKDEFADGLRARYGHVARFTGWVPEHDVARWFAAADVALFPYPKPFSSSGALALALSLGTPVLLSPALARCAGAPSAVTASTDPAQLAARLQHLARHPQELWALGEWTATLALGRSWDAVARRHLDLYQETTHAARTARRRLRAG